MSTLDKDDANLIAIKIRLLEQVKDIDVELRSRAARRELIALKALIPDWESELRHSYYEGFHTGVTWTAEHRPGGPFILEKCLDHERFYRKDISREEFNARAVLSEHEHREWMRGWDDGKKHQDKLRGLFS